MNVKQFSNDSLISETKSEIERERRSTLAIIKFFQEIQDRKLHLAMGYPNFYEMATRYFGDCAGSAMRRISAMKLVREMPQFESKIESRNPKREKRETSHAISHDRLRVSFSISKELNDNLNHLKDLLSHVDPTMTTETLFERLAELGLERHDPVRRAARAQARKDKQRRKFENGKPRTSGKSTSAAEVETPAEVETRAEVTRTRYVTAYERYHVENDTFGCTYKDANTGRRCGSRKFSQLDHVEPFRAGGANEARNLRWMCGPHNRFRVR